MVEKYHRSTKHWSEGFILNYICRYRKFQSKEPADTLSTEQKFCQKRLSQFSIKQTFTMTATMTCVRVR